MCEVEVDCPEEGKKKDDWTKPMRSAMSLMAWESRSDIKHRLATKHPEKVRCVIIALPY